MYTYIKKKVLETIGAAPRRFYGSEMERGDELEPIGRAKYEYERKVEVVEVGFVTLGDDAGCSPDGLVGDDGMIEIKARNSDIHLELLLEDKIDSGTVNQIQFNLHVTGRKWCDFISYNPNFKKSTIYIQRVFRDEVAIAQMKVGILKGAAMYKELLSRTVIKEELKANEHTVANS